MLTMELIAFIRKIWQASMPLRFLLVGGWNFIFGYLVFAGLYYFFSDCISEHIIVIISSILGITNSFIFHRWLTYQSKGVWWKEYFKFYVVYGGQIVLNLILVEIFVSHYKLNAYCVQFLILVFLTLLSYWGHKYFSFKKN